jgi:predicted nucleic acid-binding protein
MSDKIFIDTNLLVYAIDSFDQNRKEHARSILKNISDQYTGVISTQVMQEFYVAATKKLNADPVMSKGILTQLTNFEIISVSPELVFSAIDCSILNRLSFGDAFIIAAAASANCKEIWTEDLNHNQIILGVRINNPFIKEK